MKIKVMDKVELVKVEDLIPYARNSRTHSAEQISQVAASIKEFGFLNPVLIDKENCIIAGHCRVLSAQKLKMEKIPCIRSEHLNDTQRRAYIIADNKLAENAGWNEEMLKLEFQELSEMDFDLSLTGFSELEIKDFNLDLAEPAAPQSDEDDVPEVEQNKFQVKRGDIWGLGKMMYCEKCGQWEYI